jgi:hypothetical protein
MLPSPWVLEVLGGPCQGRSFSLPPNDTVTIGRAEEALIFLPHDTQLLRQLSAFYGLERQSEYRFDFLYIGFINVLYRDGLLRLLFF